jgi:hypothetical protein
MIRSYIVGNRMPMFDELCHRLFSFHFACLHSCNKISFVCRHSITSCCSLSPHGRNLLVLYNRNNVETDFLLNVNQRCVIARRINNIFSEPLSKYDYAQLLTLTELLFFAGNTLEFSSPSVLSTSEINCLIHDLRTAPF